jgi:protein MAK11
MNGHQMIEYELNQAIKRMLTIVAGAYDGTLHGWQGEDYTSLKLSFAFRAHESCIRSMDLLGKIACTAASDESIQIYDLQKKKVLDKMSGVHEDEVTALAFTEDADHELFLISGDLKGRLFVWAMKDRQVIHELKGHKQSSAVTSISVHPSGRVALSTAKDNSVRLWDLINAKAAPRTKLDDFKTLSCICWSPKDGARYAVIGNDTIMLVFDAITGSEKPLGTFNHPRRVNALKFVQDVVVASACDDGILRILGADGSVIRELAADTPCRVRDIAFTSRSGRDEENDEETVVAGAFSDGSIRLWNLDEDHDEPIAILNVGTASHMTCIGISWTSDTPTRASLSKQSTYEKANEKKRTKISST